MSIFPPVSIFVAGLVMLVSLPSCSSQVRTVHGVSISKCETLPPAEKIQTGVIYEMPLHSEESWSYLDSARDITFSWHLFPSAALPVEAVVDDEWPAQLKRDCINWANASRRVSGWPSKASLMGLIQCRGIECPLYEWSGLQNHRKAFEYVTSVRLGNSALRAEIRFSTAGGSFDPLPAERLKKALEELLASEAWNRLWTTRPT